MIALSLVLVCALPPDFHANRYDYHLAAGLAFSVPLDLLNGPIAKANHEPPPKLFARAAQTAFSGWGLAFGKELGDGYLWHGHMDMQDAVWTEGGVMLGFTIFEGTKAIVKALKKNSAQRRAQARIQKDLEEAEAIALEDSFDRTLQQRLNTNRIKFEAGHKTEIRGTLTLIEASH